MKTEIIDIISRANFNTELVKHISDEFPVDFIPLIDDPFQYDFPDNPLMDLSERELLFTLLYELIPLKELYNNKNIPNYIFYDTLDDINFHSSNYFNSYGKYSINKEDLPWLSFIYKCEIFDLGSLRFQKSRLSYEDFERPSSDYMPLSVTTKKRFKEGEPIIKVHIQKNANLHPDKIKKSFQLANDFFTTFFPEHNYNIFTCRSWMLFSPTQDLLPSDSKIKAFADYFEIIATNQNPKQALERIYGTNNLKKIEQQEKQTSLAKTAYKNLNKLGGAIGIILKDNI